MIELLGTGLWLTVWGMGLVFLLLAVLWGIVRVMLWFDRSADVAEVAQTATVEVKTNSATMPFEQQTTSPDLLAAITIAVLMHRAVRRKQAAPLMRMRLPSTHTSRWVMAGRARQNGNWGPTRR